MKPAPFRLDTGATWLNLLATKGSAFGRHPEERIPTAERFADWLKAVELTPAAPITADDLDLALHLRETLRPLALSAAAGATPQPEAAHELIAFLAAHDDPLTLAVTSTTPALTRAAPPTAAAALGRIAHQAAEHLTGPEREALVAEAARLARTEFPDRDVAAVTLQGKHAVIAWTVSSWGEVDEEHPATG
ncbi:MAG: hypothetical protein HOV83_21240, partial [Catenulispora sp.]|nr:hypothetical protein [Catenulispora sp.]